MDKRRDNRVRRGLAAYVAMIGLVGIVAGIVGWRLLQEDRALQRQQIDDRLETSADALALELRTAVAAMRASLAEFALSEPNPSAPVTQWVEDLPGDTLVALFDDDSVRAWPRDRLLFRPIPEDHGPGLQSFYTEGEVLEFREANPLAAAAFFAELGESEDAGVRAGALVRLARNLRKLGRHQEALDAYDRLFDCGEAYVDGRPAELLARQGRLATWNEIGDGAALELEARGLLDSLKRPGWAVSRVTFEHYWSEANSWLAGTADFAPEQLPEPVFANALAVEQLWIDWRAGRDADGLTLIGNRDRPVLVVGQPLENTWIGLIAGPDFVSRQIIDKIEPLLDRYRAEVLLLDQDGRSLVPSTISLDSPTMPIARRTTAETGLPWTLHVFSADLDEELALLAGRRRFLAAGLVVMSVLLVAGGVLSAQSIRRELKVADLKSSLVAAVSHEFRTPLTLLRQTTEALADGRVESADDRHRYYDRQLRATDRLQRLVEGMLDFGRLEAGAFELVREPFELTAWVQEVAESFNVETANDVTAVRVDASSPDTLVHADRDALTRALWNLLDNAVKYSPARAEVEIKICNAGGQGTVQVCDRGPGIAADERQAIFDRFARGRDAPGQTQGTGLGLAMAREIARVHGGDVVVESRSGGGSIFALSIPVEESR